ncbi:TetR/AcrR family transcriptional regulator [Rhodococcus sp. WS3]|uniref:TetR/AcrR family transcriptional regulator n=1 Tax=Rhodococcus sp. WS3 TaxID=2486271 RepID=UPI001141555B|nr:TetR/AcrR family transcriptional regulator [Rhodococcus sp. WS3]ROZ49044.1 TetR/AcrR family transcriptional regulator [Rhodococcus sp. WS3]
MEGDSSSNSRTREIGVRKGEIRDAALTLFSDRGYYGTGMEHIASAVGLAPSSLYNHWKSKQDLLQDIMEATLQELLAAFDVATRDAQTPADALRAAMDAHVRYHATHNRDARVGNREISSLASDARERVRATRREYAASWRQLIAQGVSDGQFDDVSPELAANALLEMGIGVSQWFKSTGSLPLDRIASEYAEMALRLVGYRT